MGVVTINGPKGAGSTELGLEVARLLRYDYFDRLVLAEVAKDMKTSVMSIVAKQERVVSIGSAIKDFLSSFLERSAVSTVAGDPYFSAKLGSALSMDYEDQYIDPNSASKNLSSSVLMDKTRMIIERLAEKDNIVIVGRGANIILKGWTNAIHIGVVCTNEHRIQYLMNKHHFDDEKALKELTTNEKARQKYFMEAFDCNPNNPELYHLVINMSTQKVESATELVCNLVNNLGK